MATTCSCGCGRPIKGIRLRAANELGRQVADELAELRGAIANDAVGERAREVADLERDGAARLEVLNRYLHGELERDDVDKGATTSWLQRSRSLSKALAAGVSGPPWEPDDPRTDGLGLSGTRARGVMTEVERAGWGNERTADLRVAVTIGTPDGSTLELRRTLSIAVVKAPRVGDQVEVAYDPDDPSRFVYRPVVELPGDAG